MWCFSAQLLRKSVQYWHCLVCERSGQLHIEHAIDQSDGLKHTTDLPTVSWIGIHVPAEFDSVFRSHETREYSDKIITCSSIITRHCGRSSMCSKLPRKCAACERHRSDACMRMKGCGTHDEQKQSDDGWEASHRHGDLRQGQLEREREETVSPLKFHSHAHKNKNIRKRISIRNQFGIPHTPALVCVLCATGGKKTRCAYSQP